MSIALLGGRKDQFFQADYKPKIRSWPRTEPAKIEKRKKKYVILVSQFKNKFKNV